MSEGLPIEIITNLVEQDTFKSVLPSAPHVDGMIFAVAAAPEIPMPEQWMPWLIQDSGSRLIDSDVDRLADELMNGLRVHLSLMREERCPLPQAILSLSNTENGHRPSRELVDWLTGLLQVHKQLEPVWQNAWKYLDRISDSSQSKTGEELPEIRLSRCLKLFTTLANVDLALKYRNDQQKEQLDNSIPLLVRQVPLMLDEYTRLAGELAGALPNQFETFVKSP
ncbi:hypothetical protein D210916BOD24_25230 [Alteromonas sp. D210916BOD_24]|uniref:UPF0149 family protein n=1 Tax=Alteromonas sp. D210916BOD_24 TaxID=3157618 RepID=UPI00399D51AA